MPRTHATVSVDAVIVRSSEPMTCVVDGELVMLDPRQSRYFALDAIGRRIWTLLEHPQKVDALCRQLEEEFAVPPERCLTDVLAFLEQLAGAELVSVS